MRQRTQHQHEQRVETAVAYILARLDEPIDPVRLAESLCLSRHHFHRVFLGMLGETVGEFTRRMRLERAALQLRSTPTSIIEIALDAGYATHEAFIRAIRQAYGCTPSSLRWSRTESLYSCLLPTESTMRSLLRSDMRTYEEN